MKFTFICALALFSFKLVAQTNVPPLNNDKLFFMQKYEKYKRMKNGGTVMILAGSIATIVGISNLSSANYTTNPYTGQKTTNDPRALSGALLVLGGIGLVGGGIPLTIVGSHQMKKYQRKIDGVSFNFNFTPQQHALVLSYKF